MGNNVSVSCSIPVGMEGEASGQSRREVFAQR